MKEGMVRSCTVPFIVGSKSIVDVSLINQVKVEEWFVTKFLCKKIAKNKDIPLLSAIFFTLVDIDYKCDFRVFHRRDIGLRQRTILMVSSIYKQHLHSMDW